MGMIIYWTKKGRFEIEGHPGVELPWNELHREDGPAFEGADGTKSWWLNGKRHRTDGPAFEWANGSKLWFLNGLRHRVDGPAIERADGIKDYWLYGKKVTEEEFLETTDPVLRKLIWG